MKRDPQSFVWSCASGTLKIEGRKDGPMEGRTRIYSLADYPDAIRQKIADAGFKAVFQQRTSQIESDNEKLDAWDALHDMFCGGEWEREGTRGAPVIAAWVEALAASKGVTVGVIQASLNKYPREQREAIKKSAEVKLAAEIVKIKEARDAAKAATVELL